VSVRGYEEYRETQIGTAPPETLIVMLYDGAIRFLGLARDAIQGHRIEEANRLIGRAQAIITELACSIDFDAGPLSHRLYGMYDYMRSRLVDANVRKDVEPLDEVVGMLSGLRDAWAAAAKSSRGGRATVVTQGGGADA